MPFWQKPGRKFQGAMPSLFGSSTGLASSQSQQEYDEHPPQQQSHQSSSFGLPGQLLRRSRSQRFASVSIVPDRTAARRSYHAPHSPSSSVLELEASPVLPNSTSTPTRVAETPEGLLIARALASGQALPQDRPSSPGRIATKSDPHHGAQDTAEDEEEDYKDPSDSGAALTQMSAPGYASTRASTDSGSSLDRFSVRRLARLNTEQQFREQRQGTSLSATSPSPNPNTYDLQNGYNMMPQPSQQGPYGPSASTTRASPSSNNYPSLNPSSPPSNTDISRSNAPQQAFQHDSSASVHVPSQQQGYFNSDALPPYQTHARPNNSPQQSRSFTQASGSDDAASVMSGQNHQQASVAKPMRSNRQSMHNGIAGTSPGSQQQQQQQQQQHQQQTQTQQSTSQQYQIPPPPMPAQYGTEREQSRGNMGRATPQPGPAADEITDEEVAQMMKDHRELRDKYTKVKKYYFEKEDQVKQLQNSLAHQRIAQSRTSLDDSEYSTRFNRLDGLIAQLAFSIRKSWKTVPSWLAGSVNKDAISTGKQEMTAAGRAFISCWLVEEVFDKYFHPDLDPTLSAQLKTIQKNIRRLAPHTQTPEEEEYLTSKVVNWRLSTLDGLQELLRSPQSADHRVHLMDFLKEHLIGALQVHLDNPPMSDLEGGVHMIIELAVSMVTHLPLESRDVQIEYSMPGSLVSVETMRQESGIPALGVSVAEDAQDRSKKLGGHAALGKHAAAGASSVSLGRPESSQGKDDMPPRVRMAVGIGAQVRGKTVLVKAPVFSN